MIFTKGSFDLGAPIDTSTFATMEEEKGQTNGRIVSMYFY